MPQEVHEAQLGRVRIIDIDIAYDKTDAGGTHYLNRSHCEERISPFYRILATTLCPDVCVDVGANYGVTGLIMARAFPQARLRLVEPVPSLEGYIRYNFDRNGATFDQLHSAMVSRRQDGPSEFGVNTRASQDSRVRPQPGFETVMVPVISLDELCDDIPPSTAAYIKIDTQGWEEAVFASGAGFLGRHARWFVKTEFAPDWMRSQGSDPVAVLRELTRRYVVFEHPGRIAWTTADMRTMLGRPVLPEHAPDFVSYVTAMAQRDRGWTDLFVLPRAAFEAGGYAA